MVYIMATSAINLVEIRVLIATKQPVYVRVAMLVSGEAVAIPVVLTAAKLTYASETLVSVNHACRSTGGSFVKTYVTPITVSTPMTILNVTNMTGIVLVVNEDFGARIAIIVVRITALEAAR